MDTRSEDDLNLTDSFEEDESIIAQPKPDKFKQKMINSIKTIIIFLFGYLLCYLGCSLILIVAFILAALVLESQNFLIRKKIEKKYDSIKAMKPKELQELLKDSSPWLSFPDWERADWINEIILILWPSLSFFLVKTFRGVIQKSIRKKYESFTFDDIDFGLKPPKIDGVKVYNKRKTKNAIIIDFDVVYDGDCDIKCEMSGTQIGRIRDFQMNVDVRVILKPLLLKVPLIGGMQIFFLNTPEINFELEGITGIPGLSYFIRQKIEEQIRKKLVFPNKITKSFTKTIAAIELKSLEPEGVLRVHVFEARDLLKKDVTGKSDPYVILKIGAQTHKTEVIARSLNPQWDYWCEFIVLDHTAQQLFFKLYDKDFNGDDFLGGGTLDIQSVVNGQSDQWIKLHDVKHGEIHLRCSWLSLSPSFELYDKDSKDAQWLKKKDLSAALLSVFVDSAKDLPCSKPPKKPDPYFVLTLGKTVQKGRVKKHTQNPTWEQGFSLLVPSPEDDLLIITIRDKETEEILTELTYGVVHLTTKDDMQISKKEFEITREYFVSKLIISLQLRILTDRCEIGDEVEEDISGVSVSTGSSASVSRQISVEDLAIQDNPSPAVKRRFLDPNNQSPSSTKNSPLGDLKLTLSYNDLGQILVVQIHEIRNLLQKSKDDIPDPYVKIKLIPSSHKEYKTKVIIDDCNPKFEETFEFLLSKYDLDEKKLLLTIKTKKYFSNKNVIGQIEIDLKKYRLGHPHNSWFPIGPKIVE